MADTCQTTSAGAGGFGSGIKFDKYVQKQFKKADVQKREFERHVQAAACYNAAASAQLTNAQLTKYGTRGIRSFCAAMTSKEMTEEANSIQNVACQNLFWDFIRKQEVVTLGGDNISDVKDLVKKLKAGTSVFARLQTQTPVWNVSMDEVANQVVLCLESVVDALQNQGLFHNDIKPRNLFAAFNTEDRGKMHEKGLHIRVGDFGLMSEQRSGSMGGTIGYTGPYLGEDNKLLQTIPAMGDYAARVNLGTDHTVREQSTSKRRVAYIVDSVLRNIFAMVVTLIQIRNDMQQVPIFQNQNSVQNQNSTLTTALNKFSDMFETRLKELDAMHKQTNLPEASAAPVPDANSRIPDAMVPYSLSNLVSLPKLGSQSHGQQLHGQHTLPQLTEETGDIIGLVGPQTEENVGWLSLESPVEMSWELESRRELESRQVGGYINTRGVKPKAAGKTEEAAWKTEEEAAEEAAANILANVQASQHLFSKAKTVAFVVMEAKPGVSFLFRRPVKGGGAPRAHGSTIAGVLALAMLAAFALT